MCYKITLRFGNKLPLQYCEIITEIVYSVFIYETMTIERFS